MPTPLVPDAPRPFPRLGTDEGLLSWVGATDHKKLAVLYFIVTFFFFGLGGLTALMMRVQLAWPGLSVLSPEAYNAAMTLHGTTMIFFVVVPLLQGMAVYLVPLMIGARDMAFPRLNALSVWLLLFSGLLLWFSVLAGDAPEQSWYSYAPLSEPPYNLGDGVTYWTLALLLVGVGTVSTGVNLAATIVKLRAPGMTMGRLPLFVWMTLVTSVLVVVAVSDFNAGLVLLLADRMLDTSFFVPSRGGDALVWQHVFWVFGHPEVYVMALPAFGIISEVIPVFSRRPIFGYDFVAGSSVAIGILSASVWVHHMFATGLGLPVLAVFSATSMLIAVPTGIKIFNWVATTFRGKIYLSTSMLFAVAFLIQFPLGGVTGVMFAAPPLDWQLTDTYFVVAHFHYVLFGGSMFAVFSGFYYWFPKVTGRMLSERLGRANFWLMVIGFNGTFGVQHALGIMGMTRRVYTYPDLPGMGALNLISTVSSFLIAASVVVFLWNVWVSLRRGKRAGHDPWLAFTLEWLAPSPPPEFNFDLVPPVRSRRPLWDLRHPDDPDWVRHAEKWESRTWWPRAAPPDVVSGDGQAAPAAPEVRVSPPEAARRAPVLTHDPERPHGHALHDVRRLPGHRPGPPSDEAP